MSLRARVLCGAAVCVLAVPAACSTKSGVQWDDYTPGLKAGLDALADSKDCAGLQEQFDIADGNNSATMNRTGHNNAELMKYLDDLMRSAGCY